MEKISNIVRGNSRVASTDLKSSSAVRPGALSFGRAVGESPQSTDKVGTTASRAVALHNEMIENKRSGKPDDVVTQMADQFFMTRVRRPVEEETPALRPPAGEDEHVPEVSAQGLHDEEEITQPSGFKPRGSFIDVQV